MRVVFDSGDCYHRARGRGAACDLGATVRLPKRGEVAARRLQPCSTCFPPKPRAPLRSAPRRRRSAAARLESYDQLRPVVLARASWRCERCGRSEADRHAEGQRVVLQAHHRLMRSHGGPDTLENLVCLCGPTPLGCHGWAHAHWPEATEAGLIIPSWEGAPSEPWDPQPSGLPRPGW